MANKRIIAVVIIIVCVALFVMLMVATTMKPAQKQPTPVPTPAPTPVPAPSPSPSCVPGTCTMETGKRYVGAASENIGGPAAIKTTLADCRDKCNANKQCKQYVYYKPNDFCYLQTVVHPDQPISDANFVSGYCCN